jgi:hypothetical protein
MHPHHRLSRVFAGITIAAVSATAGWIGGIMVTRAQVIAIVDQLPAPTPAGVAGACVDPPSSSADASGRSRADRQECRQQSTRARAVPLPWARRSRP